MALTAKEKLFIEEYLKDRNGAGAALRAGYASKNAHAYALALLKRPEIKAIVNVRLLQIAKDMESVWRVNQVNVLGEVAKIAFADPTALVDDDGDVRDIKDIPEALRGVISIETNKAYGTTMKIRAADKITALGILAKHLKLLGDTMEHTGANGAPLEIIKIYMPSNGRDEI